MIDHDRLVSALRKLTPSITVSTSRAWTRTPAVRVIDCILSLNRSYDRVVVPRLDGFEKHYPTVQSVSDLVSVMALTGSPARFVSSALRYNDAKRAETLSGVAHWLMTISGAGKVEEQLQNVELWAQKCFFKPIPGTWYQRFWHISLSISPNAFRCEYNKAGHLDLSLGRGRDW